jgi:hypothetical protein
VQAGVIAVMAVAETVKFTIDRLNRRVFQGRIQAAMRRYCRDAIKPA